jgi:hypothetical protein
MNHSATSYAYQQTVSSTKYLHTQMSQYVGSLQTEIYTLGEKELKTTNI